MGYDIKLALDAKAQLGETPIWHPEKGVLYWTDGFAGEFRVYDPETGKEAEATRVNIDRLPEEVRVDLVTKMGVSEADYAEDVQTKNS